MNPGSPSGSRKALLALVIAILVLAILLWRVSPPRSTEEAGGSSSSAAAEPGAVQNLEAPSFDTHRSSPVETHQEATPTEPASSAASASTFYFVHVVDAAGKPISGASVSSCSEPVGFRPASTDESGAAAVLVLASREHVDDLLWQAWDSSQGLKIEAAGFSPAFVDVEPGHMDPTASQEIRLSAADGLTVVVRSPRGDGIRGVSVSLSSPALQLLQVTPSPPIRMARSHSNGSDIETTRSSMRECKQEFVWTRVTNENGIAEIGDLPPQCTLDLLLSDEHRIRWNQPIAVKLETGETRALELTFGMPSDWTGLLVDEFDEPVPRTRIGLIRANTFSAYRYLGADSHCLDVAMTDSAGRFSFKSCPPGVYFAGPIDSGDRSSRACAARADRFNVPILAGLEPCIVHTQRGAFIRGMVLDSKGEPVAGARVLARPKGGSGSLHARSDQQGRFALGPLFPEPFLVHAWKNQQISVPDTTEIQGGESEALLRLE